MRRGLFISFEGPEGSGKSTQVTRLCAALEKAGIQVHCLREPGGTPTGEVIRGILQHDTAGEAICPETEVLLFAASRAQLVRARILPALERGTWVVCDRFADSTAAYQGYGRGFGVEKMRAINDFAIGDAIPNRTYLIDVDGATATRRLRIRTSASGEDLDRIERESRAFHETVRRGYLSLAEAEPDRFLVIDGTDDEEGIAERIWSDIERIRPR